MLAATGGKDMGANIGLATLFGVVGDTSGAGALLAFCAVRLTVVLGAGEGLLAVLVFVV
jgi:hypothetical protein